MLLFSGGERVSSQSDLPPESEGRLKESSALVTLYFKELSVA
jgi:hypothetical protein